MEDRGFFLTLHSIRRQLAAMPNELYLVRLIHQRTRRPVPGERLWTAAQLADPSTVRFLRARNRDGCDVYVVPYAGGRNSGYVIGLSWMHNGVWTRKPPLRAGHIPSPEVIEARLGIPFLAGNSIASHLQHRSTRSVTRNGRLPDTYEKTAQEMTSMTATSTMAQATEGKFAAPEILRARNLDARAIIKAAAATLALHNDRPSNCLKDVFASLVPGASVEAEAQAACSKECRAPSIAVSIAVRAIAHRPTLLASDFQPVLNCTPCSSCRLHCR